ncbi:hypothetical protein [Halobacillus yeomjeoni]|uniref:SCP2 domain-containing protein n=1 Tax=Halobacillus yeomjeoni TaxID=311194 RepID=A0A931MVG7_9BACI|nr:hypothetical protein [Halobacillus yeomjeoni]MBH0231013.1 hypothetical protein [Halobacillus yeomjeoni]
MVDFVYDWVTQVNDRNDLLPIWRERNLDLVLQTEHQSVNVAIDHSGVSLRPSQKDEAIFLKAPEDIIEELLRGEKKLTSISSNNCHIEGAYNHILFVESLLFLSSK